MATTQILSKRERLVLCTIGAQSIYAYDIYKQIHNRAGKTKLPMVAIFPILQDLNQKGLVYTTPGEVSSEVSQRYYQHCTERLQTIQQEV